MRLLSTLATLLLFSACGRYFPSALEPAQQQTEGMAVNDDGSITYALDRLAITLKPMTDAELNRLASNPDNLSVNPYTFGDATAPGEDWTPPRFTVFRLKVANYQFPKVELEPYNARITAANNRHYAAMHYAQLYNYYRAFWLGRTGMGRKEFQARTDALKQTMYSGATVFSGNDEQGYIVFPLLDDDVRNIQVHLKDVAVRFDYTGNPIETLDLSFSFQRDILRGYTPASAVQLD
jgi:hypothetical protein